MKKGEVDKSYSGGLFGSFTAGFLYHLRKGRAWSFAVGSKFQKMTAKDNISNKLDFQSYYNN